MFFLALAEEFRWAYLLGYVYGVRAGVGVGEFLRFLFLGRVRSRLRRNVSYFRVA